MTTRALEQAKYVDAYLHPDYGMGLQRKAQAELLLAGLPRGSYLDVGCGRGEMLAEAGRLGFNPVRGVEIVPDLVDDERVVHGEAHEIPFKTGAFDVVSMFDVMEHLIASDSELVCRELERVSRKAVVLTVANYSHVYYGVELHITRRPYDDWHHDFCRWFAGRVERVAGPKFGSDGWIIHAV